MQLLFRIAPLLLTDHHDGTALEIAHAADDRGIVAEKPVAVQLTEIRKHALNIIERMGPLGVARQLDALPRWIGHWLRRGRRFGSGLLRLFWHFVAQALMPVLGGADSGPRIHSTLARNS